MEPALNDAYWQWSTFFGATLSNDSSCDIFARGNIRYSSRDVRPVLFDMS